jgi:hypothetical protein
MSDGLSDGLGVAKERLLREKDVLDATSDDPVAHGVDVSELFSELYREEYQFQRRHPREVLLPISKEQRMRLLIGASFGEFPSEVPLRYLRKTYEDAFDAKPCEISATNLLTTFQSRSIFPLRMGSSELKVQPSGWHHDPALFYMDATSPIDIVDFWNLRAIGWRVFPVPRQWAHGLVDHCSRIVRANHVPYRHNKAIMHGTTLLCSRSVDVAEVEAFRRKVVIPGPQALLLQRWYPRLWDEWARDKDQVVRCSVTADEAEVEVTLMGSNLTFRDLSPRFANRFGGHGKPRWANVVQIRDYMRSADFAAVIPAGLPEIARLLGAIGFRRTWATREGIVIACEHKEWSHRWTLPTGLDVFRSWASGQSFEVDLSGPGSITDQMIRALGGFWGIHLVGHRQIIELLNQMASGLVEQELGEDQGGKKSRKVRGKIVKVGEWRSRLKQINNGHDDLARRHLDFLVQHKVLRVGLRLQCPVCGQHNWYSPGSLAAEVQCDRCLQTFSFPATEPPPDAWYYRTIGPFSVENYAQGAYCVALALRFLGHTLHAEQTWVPSFVLKKSGSLDLEADFAAFWRWSAFYDNDPYLVFGECKTYGEFEAKDVLRMRELARNFPGAILAFCTLRPELTSSEKNRLAALARFGRRRLRAERWKHPVLILTAVELFSDHGPPYCWKDAGGKLAAFAETFHGFGGITELSDATQQLHLGIESYWQWYEKRVANMRAKWAQRAYEAKASPPEDTSRVRGFGERDGQD